MTSKAKIFEDFDKGFIPKDIKDKYPIKPVTLYRYYSLWKQEKCNPISQQAPLPSAASKDFVELQDDMLQEISILIDNLEVVYLNPVLRSYLDKILEKDSDRFLFFREDLEELKIVKDKQIESIKVEMGNEIQILESKNRDLEGKLSEIRDIPKTEKRVQELGAMLVEQVENYKRYRQAAERWQEAVRVEGSRVAYLQTEAARYQWLANAAQKEWSRLDKEIKEKIAENQRLLEENQRLNELIMDHESRKPEIEKWLVDTKDMIQKRQQEIEALKAEKQELEKEVIRLKDGIDLGEKEKQRLQKELSLLGQFKLQKDRGDALVLKEIEIERDFSEKMHQERQETRKMLDNTINEVVGVATTFILKEPSKPELVESRIRKELPKAASELIKEPYKLEYL